MKEGRKIEKVIRKLSFKEAEEENLFQWLEVPFEDRWYALENMRRVFCELHKIPYTGKMERVMKIGR